MLWAMHERDDTERPEYDAGVGEIGLAVGDVARVEAGARA